jgi:hypothetical protein
MPQDVIDRIAVLARRDPIGMNRTNTRNEAVHDVDDDAQQNENDDDEENENDDDEDGGVPMNNADDNDGTEEQEEAEAEAPVTSASLKKLADTAGALPPILESRT